MAQTTQAKDISLEDLQEILGLQLTSDPNFFPEWTIDLPSITNGERQALDRVKSNYFNLATRRPMSEEAVKMVVLSPLLDLAGFYQAPFMIETESAVVISAEDEEKTVRGNIDVLVINKRLWVLVIESKSTRFDVTTALPQALAYMLANPTPKQPVFGFLLNGREFVFVKVQPETLQYSRSYALSIEREGELDRVLSVLKRLGTLILSVDGELPSKA